MQRHIAWTLRYLVGLSGQHKARENAAEGSATLRDRRHEQEDADAYLQAARLTGLADEPEARRNEYRADHTL